MSSCGDVLVLYSSHTITLIQACSNLFIDHGRIFNNYPAKSRGISSNT